ncbi:MAG: hypothetical protein WBX30_07965 [Stellaceae bacterium]
MNRGSGRNNPFQDAVREVRVKLDAGKVLRILSNERSRRFGPGDRRYLQTALGHRAVLPMGQADPQNPPLLGISENAVRIQIAVALIAFLLLRLAQAGQQAVTSPLAFARLVRLNLMHRRPIHRLLDPETSIPTNPDQMAL